MAIFDVQFPEDVSINAEFSSDEDSLIQFTQNSQVETSLSSSETFEVEEFQTTDENGLYFQFDNGAHDIGDYSALINKPKINSVEVIGDKTGAQYGLEYSIGKTEFNDKTRVYIESSFGVQSSVEIEEGTDVDYATYNDVLAYLNE